MLLTPLAPGFWYLHCSALYLYVSHYHSELLYHALSLINEQRDTASLPDVVNSFGVFVCLLDVFVLFWRGMSCIRHYK